VYLVGYIIEIYYDAPSYIRQKSKIYLIFREQFSKYFYLFLGVIMRRCSYDKTLPDRSMRSKVSGTEKFTVTVFRDVIHCSSTESCRFS